ncbi:MAG: CRTAC1 family protein, partial [Acidobacteriota bacterium]
CARTIRADDASLLRVVDVTDAAGLTFVHDHGGTGRKYLPETMGAGGCVLDYDGDGWMDLFLVQSGTLRSSSSPASPASPAGHRLYRGRPPAMDAAPRLIDVTARAGLDAPAPSSAPRYGQGAVCGDVDGDGWPDIVITGLGPNRLLRNRGDGTFVDATARAGLGDDAAWSSSAVLFDPDRDGDLDLYVVNYLAWTLETHQDCRYPEVGDVLFYCHPDVYPGAPDAFYRNRGDGVFTRADAAFTGRVDPGKGLGAVASDLDGDGWIDLYVTNDSTPNHHHRNRGDGTFVEDGLLLGTAYNAAGRTEAGMGVDAGDIDGDGALDLIVTNLSLETNTLYRGGPTGFVDATRAAGLHGPSYAVLGFGVDWLDADLDGDLDLFVLNGDVLDNVDLLNDALRWHQPAQLFWNDGRGRFRPASAATLGPLATPRVGRSSLTFDADHDGRPDLVATYSGAPARFYHLQGAAPRDWLGVALGAVGVPGARLALAVSVGSRQLREARAGSSYQSSGDPRLRFGLGAVAGADAPSPSLDVVWPAGVHQRYRDVPRNRYLRLTPPRRAR